MNDIKLGIIMLWRKYERPILTAIQAGVAVFAVAAINAIMGYFDGGAIPTDIGAVITVGASAGMSALILWIRTKIQGQHPDQPTIDAKAAGDGKHFKTS